LPLLASLEFLTNISFFITSTYFPKILLLPENAEITYFSDIKKKYIQNLFLDPKNYFSKVFPIFQIYSDFPDPEKYFPTFQNLDLPDIMYIHNTMFVD